jgi:hypothetical protein
MTVLVITGTGTGVGKPIATAALASHARGCGGDVAVCKPVQTGSGPGAQGGDDDLAEIARRAFTPRKSGNLDMQRIRDLRNYTVKHPTGLKACEIISDCERTIGYCRYIRVSVRPDSNAQPKDIPLDIARV